MRETSLQKDKNKWKLVGACKLEACRKVWLVKPLARGSKWPFGLVGRACDDDPTNRPVRCAALRLARMS